MTHTIAIIATLDTKGKETRYFQKRISDAGIDTLVIDSGILRGPVAVEPNITRDQVAQAAGYSLTELQREYRAPAIKKMMVGVARVVKEAYERGQFQAIICIGGEDGAHLGAAGMRELPVGVPKVIVSPIFQGTSRFGSYVDTNDMILVHSVIDILGINTISQKVFDNAIASIVGMVREDVGSGLGEGNRIAVTMFGNTTPAVEAAKEILEGEDYEVIVFHPNGTGGRAMEKLILAGIFSGVLDLTTHEITDDLFGGLHGAPKRLENACRSGTPLVFVPGCMDFITAGAVDELPEKYSGRSYYPHNPTSTLVRATREEMELQGREVVARLNRSTGPVAVLFPLRGLSMYNKEGLPIFDPKGDRALLETLRHGLKPDIEVIEVDAHINDLAFARAACSALLALIARGRG